MKFIKTIIDFFKNLFGFKKEVEPVKYEEVLKNFGSAPPKSLEKEEEEEYIKRTFSQMAKDYRDDKRASLSDTNLILYYNIIKKQVEDGTRDGTVLIEYINELEYRGLKYEEIIWSNTDRFSKIIKY